LVRGFMRNIPKSLDEAASIDGATPLQILRMILLPLIVPIIGFISISAFMAPWLDFILQFRFLQPENMTVAVWLFRTTDPFNTLFYNPLRFMAGALLIAIPIMIIQFFMQRYMVYGLTSGAEKG
jgi:arabinogalactan oligomer / maltooligosaccharide transport system permease protein